MNLSDRLRAADRKLFVPYVTAGLPSPQEFISLVADLSSYADAIEIGIPFSDPIMDGPVIQEASQKAMEEGITVKRSVELVGQAARHVQVPLVPMTYFNPIHRAGIPQFAKSLFEAGAAGIIIPDLPLEESDDVRHALEPHEIALIQLVAPTTTPERAALIARASQGWVYAVSRLGVTGERSELASEAARVVHHVRQHATVPILLGIGISNGDQARSAAALADGVIVGSAIVRKVHSGDIDGALALAKEIRTALGP